MIHRQHPMLAALFALILTVTLTNPVLGASAPTVPAEPPHSVVTQADPATTTDLKFTEEMAIKVALGIFPIPKDLGKPSINLWTDTGKYGRGPTWNLTWEKDPRLGGIRTSYSVGVHAQSGEIVSYNVYQYDPSGQQPAVNFTREEAQSYAEEWYQKLVPAEKKTEFQADQPNANNELNYTWVRMENNIPFFDNTINITINPSDGTLISFYRNWDQNLSFPAVEGIISKESAQASYDKVGSVELIYQRCYTPAGRSDVRLIYVSRANDANIDALTGQVVDYHGKAWAGQGKPIDLGSSETKLFKREKQMTREEALALARQFLSEDAKIEPSYASYNAPGEPAGKWGDQGIHVSTWNFSWDIPGKEANQSRYLSAAVDVDHGVLIGFNCYDGYVTDEQLREKTPVNEEAARNTAIDFVKRARPDLINNISITDISVSEKYPGWPADKPLPIQREYYFNFGRMVNGHRFDGDNVSVSIDCFSGTVRNFYLNWSESEFPSLDKVKLTPAQAIDVLKLEAPLRLVYTRSYTPYSENDAQVRLVYRPYNSYSANIVDPVTGHLHDFSGRDVTELRRGAEDIADHPALREIQLMINRGVFEVQDGKFRPEVNMTRGDLAKALVIAFNQGNMVPEFNRMATLGKGGGAPDPSYADVNYDNGYFGYVEAAVRAGILMPQSVDEKLNPDQVVTNEELALLTSRAMGYAKIINMKTTITNAFTDAAKIGAEYRNAVGLLAGLEVLSNNGEFKPQDKLIRAYAAKVLALAVQNSQPRYYY